MPIAAAGLPYLQRFQPLAYVLVLLAVGAFGYAEPNLPLFVVAAAATGLSWWLVEGKNGKPLPRFIINLGVLTAALGLFYELVIAPGGGGIQSANLLLSLGHFMEGILLCKLFERKSNRDYAQILALTLLIMVAGAIVATASLLFAFLLALYLALGLYAILLFHLRGETERALAQNLATVQNGLAGEPSRSIRRDLRLVAAWSAVGLVAMATTVFMLVPRSPMHDYLSPWGDASSTGFTEQVHMPEDLNLRLSDAVAMEVKLEQDGINIGSESYSPYFRGTVRDAYDNKTHDWVRSWPREREDHSLTGDSPVQLVPPEQYSPVGLLTQTYNLHSSNSRMLFSEGPPAAFASEHLATVEFWPRQLLIGTRGSVVRPLSYKVVSPVICKPAMFADSLFVTPGDLSLHGSTDADRPPGTVPDEVANLARKVVRDLLPENGTQLQPEKIRPIAERIENYLKTTYPYSLQFHAVDYNLDPTVDFLLNRKSIGGHCEFFASAMVMMCRAVGINARMATGYHGGEFNTLDGYYVVKEKDAHAWVEVFLPERGWTVFDPSPAAPESSKSFAITRWFQEISQMAQRAWLSTVVAFDNTSRKYIFSSISSIAQSLGGWMKTVANETLVSLRVLLFDASTPPALKLVGFATIGTMVGLALWLGKRWQRRRTSQLPLILKTVDRKVQKQLAHDLLFYDDLLRLLGRHARRRRAEETPREYVENLSGMLGNAANDARWLVDTFYDIRFGTARVSLAMREKIGTALHRVREVMANS